jgi:hypothetical protein
MRIHEGDTVIELSLDEVQLKQLLVAFDWLSHREFLEGDLEELHRYLVERFPSD